MKSLRSYSKFKILTDVPRLPLDLVISIFWRYHTIIFIGWKMGVAFKVVWTWPSGLWPGLSCWCLPYTPVPPTWQNLWRHSLVVMVFLSMSRQMGHMSSEWRERGDTAISVLSVMASCGVRCSSYSDNSHVLFTAFCSVAAMMLCWRRRCLWRLIFLIYYMYVCIYRHQSLWVDGDIKIHPTVSKYKQIMCLPKLS